MRSFYTSILVLAATTLFASIPSAQAKFRLEQGWSGTPHYSSYYMKLNCKANSVGSDSPLALRKGNLVEFKLNWRELGGQEEASISTHAESWKGLSRRVADLAKRLRFELELVKAQRAGAQKFTLIGDEKIFENLRFDPSSGHSRGSANFGFMMFTQDAAARGLPAFMTMDCVATDFFKD